MIESGYFLNPITRDIAIVQGDTCSFGFELQGLKGERPSSIILTCKNTIEDDTPLFMVSDNDTIDERAYNESNDTLTYTVRIPPYLTQDIALGRYFYDLQVVVNNDVITLMRGRLSLEYQVTKVTVSPPVAEDGDEILYPRDDIQEGAKKLYTESKVNDISNKINELLNQAYEANIGAFSNELAAANGMVGGLSTQLNYYLMSETTYKLPTITNGVEALFDSREGVIDGSIEKIYTEVLVIPKYKFMDSSLEEIKADNVQDIKADAFNNCKSLSSISFDSVEKIGERAFKGDSALTGTLYFPKLTEIYDEAFYLHTADGEGLTTLKLSNEALGEGENFTLSTKSLADNTGAVTSSNSIFRWIDVDNYHFAGEIATKPSDNVETIEVSDPYLYATNPQEVEVREGLVIFVEDELKPYVYEGGSWIEYIPTKSVSYVGDEVYHSTRIRDIGFKVGTLMFLTSAKNTIFRGSRVLFLILDKDAATLLDSFSYAGDLKAILTTDSNGHLTDVLPYTSLGGAFYKCGSLKSVKLPYLATCEDGTFRDTGLITLDLPSLTTLGRASTYQGFTGSGDLESISIGDGTNSLSILGTGHFSNCAKLFDLTLDITAVPPLSASNQTMQALFSGSPIYQYLGTTTTEIVEGATAGSVVIDGVTKSTVNGNIVSYNGEDYQRVSNKWAKWGNAQDKTPRINVPSNLKSSFTSHAKWGTLSPEIWRDIV